MPEQPESPRSVTQTQSHAESIGSEVDETASVVSASTFSSAPGFGPSAEPGELGRLGPYRIVKELGRGGMGAVYLGIDTRLNRKLAMKVMLPQFAAIASAKERFLREARVAAQITHDNVVTVYEADERDGVPYIAMQFLQGYPLDEYLKRKGNLSLAQSARIVREAAAGLAAAHAIGLIHRDIKPGNLWLEAPKGRVKVLDFGLAKPVDSDVELTKSGAVVGTPAYMAPEQARGIKVDARADLWSLGVLLYRLCAGRIPFEGPNTMAVLMAIGTEEPRPIRALNPQVPESLAALIHQLLAKQPEARVQTAAEVMRRLNAIEDERSVPIASAVEQSTSQPQVIYVPIHVSAQPEDNSAFAGLGATELESEADLDEPAGEPRPALTGPGKRRMWIMTGIYLLAAAVMLGGVIIFIKNKDGTTTKIEAPDGATVTVKDGKGRTIARVPGGKPSSVATDPDRKAAEYVLSIGGSVRVDGNGADIKAAANLPKNQFVLSSIDLSNKQVSDPELVNFKGLKNLTSLNLNGTQVGHAGLAHLKELKSLTILSLIGTKVSEAGLVQIKELKNLRVLFLHNTQVGDSGMAQIKELKSLTDLHLRGTQVTDLGLAHLKEHKSLKVLNLAYTKVTDTGLAQLKELKNLTSLELNATKVTAKGLADFHAAVPGCKIYHDGGVIEATIVADPDRKAAEYVLSMGGSVKVNGENRDIKAPAELPKERFTLSAVNLMARPVTDAGLANFKDCKGLRYLDLAHTQVSDAGLVNFKETKKLITISLNGTQVTDAGLAHFKNCNGLRALALTNTQVTDAGLAHFKDCKALEILHLHSAQVTDAGLGHFKTCKGLTSLHLGFTQISDAGLADFKDCKSLIEINLAGTQVSDAGLADFKDCKSLTTLNLSYTKLTDAGLEHFKNCKGLATLDVRKTKVTAKGLAGFHAAVPGCKIEHDGGVIEAKK